MDLPEIVVWHATNENLIELLNHFCVMTNFSILGILTEAFQMSEFILHIKLNIL